MKAYLYTWGEGRNTAEGEHIPVRIESLDIGYIDGQLLLPLIEEHTIDERSPLCGHTYMSLKAVSSCAYSGHLSACMQSIKLISIATANMMQSEVLGPYQDGMQFCHMYVVCDHVFAVCNSIVQIMCVSCMPSLIAWHAGACRNCSHL